jgi:hypothetical protein
METAAELISPSIRAIKDATADVFPAILTSKLAGSAATLETELSASAPAEMGSLWLAGSAPTADATSSASAEAGSDARADTDRFAIEEAVTDTMADAVTSASLEKLATFDTMLAADNATLATADADPRWTTADVLEFFIRILL